MRNQMGKFEFYFVIQFRAAALYLCRSINLHTENQRASFGTIFDYGIRKEGCIAQEPQNLGNSHISMFAQDFLCLLNKKMFCSLPIAHLTSWPNKQKQSPVPWMGIIPKDAFLSFYNKNIINKSPPINKRLDWFDLIYSSSTFPLLLYLHSKYSKGLCVWDCLLLMCFLSLLTCICFQYCPPIHHSLPALKCNWRKCH